MKPEKARPKVMYIAESFRLSATPISWSSLFRTPRSKTSSAITSAMNRSHIHSGLPKKRRRRNSTMPSRGCYRVGRGVWPPTHRARSMRSDIAQLLAPEGPVPLQLGRKSRNLLQALAVNNSAPLAAKTHGDAEESRAGATSAIAASIGNGRRRNSRYMLRSRMRRKQFRG